MSSVSLSLAGLDGLTTGLPSSVLHKFFPSSSSGISSSAYGLATVTSTRSDQVSSARTLSLTMHRHCPESDPRTPTMVMEQSSCGGSPEPLAEAGRARWNRIRSSP